MKVVALMDLTWQYLWSDNTGRHDPNVVAISAGTVLNVLRIEDSVCVKLPTEILDPDDSTECTILEEHVRFV